MNKILIVLILLISCGKNADQTNADNFILDHERPEPINQRINLAETPRDFTLFAFPNQSEVGDFSLLKSSTAWDEETMVDLLSMIDYGDKYLHEIPLEMSPAEKVQSIIGKVIAISDARDNTIRGSYLPKINSIPIINKYKNTLNSEFPCFEVSDKNHPNYRKCYIKEVKKITKTSPKKWRFEKCRDMIAAVSSYLDASIDENISETGYLLSEDVLPNWKEESQTCAQNQEIVEKNKGRYGNGTKLVALLIGAAQQGAKNKLLFKAKSDFGDLDGAGDMESTIIFNPETLTFEKFSVAIDFYDGSGPAIYSPEDGNMTAPVVSEINNSGFYRVDFEFKTPNFTLKTQGLSLAIDPVFGLRVSGKTKLYYPDGKTRDGIIRFDVSAIE